MNKINFRKFYLFFFILSAIVFVHNIINAQELTAFHADENWVFKDGLYYEPQIYFRYDNYSIADTVKFREKLSIIKSSNPQNEWEGTYSVGVGEVSIPQFRWNSSAGFISYYINTCNPSLESIDYGSVINTTEYIELLPEKTEDSPRKIVPSRYVKVKWGKDFYLVEESSLQAFAEKAVGIYVETEEDAENENFQKWSNFMVNRDESMPIECLPEFPPSYRKFQRSPTEAKILTLGKRTVESEKILGGTVYGGDTAFYAVTIDAGKNKNVKVGMKFEIPETKEELVITKVNQNSSVGLVSRFIDDSKNDLCRDDKYEPALCPQIKASFKVKTQIGRFLY